MVREGDYVVVFHSMHRVMKAEKVLKVAKRKILLIPVPRQLTSDCGLAIRFEEAEHEQVVTVLVDNDLLPAETYQLTGEGYVLIDEKPNG